MGLCGRHELLGAGTHVPVPLSEHVGLGLSQVVISAACLSGERFLVPWGDGAVVEVDGQEDFVGDWCVELFGELADESCGSGQ